MYNDIEQYGDIIKLEPPEPRRRMARIDRAAQFSPFAALTGFDAMLSETARLTDERAELSDEDAALLNERLLFLSENSDERPEVSVTFFLPDKSGRGGKYVTEKGAVKRIDEAGRTLVFTDGGRLPIDDIYRIDGDVFNGLRKKSDF